MPPILLSCSLPCFITSEYSAGLAVPIRGRPAALLVLPSSQDSLRIEFVQLGLVPAEDLGHDKVIIKTHGPYGPAMFGRCLGHIYGNFVIDELAVHGVVNLLDEAPDPAV